MKGRFGRCAALALLTACHDWVDCPTGDDVLAAYEIDGLQVILGADGAAWIARKGRCRFAAQSFDPDFVAQHYAIEGVAGAGERLWKGRIEVWLARDAAGSPLQILIERGWASVLLVQNPQGEDKGAP